MRTREPKLKAGSELCHRDFGTEVPCSDKAKHQFIEMKGAHVVLKDQ